MQGQKLQKLLTNDGGESSQIKSATALINTALCLEAEK
jgi:hypothetical protein